MLVKIGDLDAVRSPHVYTRLDDGADVIGVDMAIPQPVAAHHHNRVAQGIPGSLELVDVLIGRREQVHHLVASARRIVHVMTAAIAGVEVTVQFGALLSDRIDRVTGQVGASVPVSDDGSHLGRQVDLVRQRAPVDHAQQCVEQQQVTGGTRVDHTGVGQHRELLRGCLQRCLAGLPCALEHGCQRRRAGAPLIGGESFERALRRLG